MHSLSENRGREIRRPYAKGGSLRAKSEAYVVSSHYAWVLATGAWRTNPQKEERNGKKET